jgi:hypothetical protein
MGGLCVTCGGRRDAYRVSVGKPDGKSRFEAPGLDGRIILKCISGSDVETRGRD